MKYMLFLTVLTTALTHAQDKSNNQFVLDGNIINQQEGFVYLSYADNSGKYIRDSVAVKNGRFQFKGFINEPTMASFNSRVTSRSMDDPNFTSLFIEPTSMKVVVTANDFKNAKVTGSATQADYDAFQTPIRTIRNRWKVVMDTLSAVNKRSNFEYQELKDWVLTPYNAEIKELELAFFNKHPQSYATAYMLRVRGRDMTADSLRVMYDRFPAKLKASAYGKTIAEDLEKKKIGIPGTTAKVFTATDIKGSNLSLSDFKGKYVLLDFWASWCVPCRKANPHLKELYAQYRDKGFEVIGVSDDDRNHEAWKTAVAKDDLPWKHVLRGYKNVNGVPDRSADISEGYNISTLPTQILVDRSGNIVARYGEDGEPHELLDNKLKSVFQ